MRIFVQKPIRSAMVSLQGPTLLEEEKKLLNHYNPLGITLFARNIETPTQVKKLISDIKSVIEREDVLIAGDQEGGRVARFKPPFFRSYMSQRSIGSFEEEKAQERAAYLQSFLIAQELKDVGVNLNYAPCSDVLFEQTGAVLKSRCFSKDENRVAVLAGIMVDTYLKNGIIPCVKHVPGHGRAQLDPHLELPILDFSLTELQKDFYPFVQLAKKTPMMMTAHIVLKEIDDLPVTQSQKIIAHIIRKEMGFNGFLISDAIDMHALKGTLTQKAICSLEAGCDAVCYCMGDLDGLIEVLKNTPVLSDDAMDRFLKLKNILNQKNTVSQGMNNMEQEYNLIKQKAILFDDDYDAVETLHKLKRQ